MEQPSEQFWKTFREGKGEVSVRWNNHFFEGVIIGTWHNGTGVCKYCGKGYKLEGTLGRHIFLEHEREFLEEFYEEVKKNGIENQ